MIRILDILISFVFLVLISPFLFFITLLIAITMGLPVFFLQTRVGRHGKDFKIIKFRTMRNGAEKSGQLTVGERDPRVTSLGVFLRKYKLDELPQFWNVLVGEMSIVGPRPEVRKYVSLYSPEQAKVLSVKPGITDFATILFRNENQIIAKYSNPEEAYIHEILPHKLKLSSDWIANPTLSNYFKIIWQTFIAII